MPQALMRSTASHQLHRRKTAHNVPSTPAGRERMTQSDRVKVLPARRQRFGRDVAVWRTLADARKSTIRRTCESQCLGLPQKGICSKPLPPNHHDRRPSSPRHPWSSRRINSGKKFSKEAGHHERTERRAAATVLQVGMRDAAGRAHTRGGNDRIIGEKHNRLLQPVPQRAADGSGQDREDDLGPLEVTGCCTIPERI